MSEVNIVKCEDYSDANVKKAFDELIPLIGGLDWVKPGMKIMIKANLVTFLKPEAAATTHPSLLCELVKRLVEKGAEVVVGDSPGGMYNSIYVNRVYSATRIDDVKKFGGKLNENFGQSIAKFDEGHPKIIWCNKGFYSIQDRNSQVQITGKRHPNQVWYHHPFCCVRHILKRSDRLQNEPPQK